VIGGEADSAGGRGRLLYQFADGLEHGFDLNIVGLVLLF
jgi:hypothetical protein